MSDEKAELLRLASEYAEKDVDLYELLGVDALTQKEDIRRAWRKQSLRYHPDKAGDKFDAEKWELFERARDILSDADVRPAYDNAIKAKLLRKQERDAMDKERKKFADDLEAREYAAANLRQQMEQRDREAMQKERERLAEEQRLRAEEKARQHQAAQEVEDLAEARRRLKEKKEEKARRKQAKESMKAGGTLGKTKGPANGVVNVPGDFLATFSGSEKRTYWELVCDKLKAVQAARNMQNEDGTALRDAEAAVQEARKRVQEAEVQFQKEATAF